MAVTGCRCTIKMIARLLLLLPLVVLQACSTGGGPRSGPAAEAPAATPGSRSSPALANRLARSLTAPAARVDAPAPDAVIKIDPGSATLAPEMHSRLAEIARLARADERSLLRLEGYVPDGGSPAWNIGAAEKSLRLVREQLESLRVPARRIQIAAFGEEHEQPRDDRRHWVEIYVVRARR